jgi:hypothetical protein
MKTSRNIMICLTDKISVMRNTATISRIASMWSYVIAVKTHNLIFMHNRVQQQRHPHRSNGPINDVQRSLTQHSFKFSFSFGNSLLRYYERVTRLLLSDNVRSPRFIKRNYLINNRFLYTYITFSNRRNPSAYHAI